MSLSSKVPKSSINRSLPCLISVAPSVKCRSNTNHSHENNDYVTMVPNYFGTGTSSSTKQGRNRPREPIPQPVIAAIWASTTVRIVHPIGKRSPRPMLANKATKDSNPIVSRAEPIASTNPVRRRSADQPEIVTKVPITSPKAKMNSDRTNVDITNTTNFAAIIASREVGSANNSFAVRSENSRPNT